MQDEGTPLVQPLDDLGVGLIDLHARPGATGADLVALEEAAVVVDGHDDGNTELHAGVVVVDAVAGRGVNHTGAVVQSDVVGVDELAGLALVAKDGLLVPIVAELDAVHAPDLAVRLLCQLVGLVAELRAILLHQSLGHDLGATVHHDGHVLGLGVQDDGVVGGHGPGGRGPDVHPEPVLVGLQALGNRGHLEADEDCGRDLVTILDLRLGQCCVAVGTPVDGLATAIDGTLIKDLLEDLDVGSVVVVGIGEVGVIPLAQDAQTLEALTLGVHLLDGYLVADLADLHRGKLVELVGAQLLFDLVLDGLAVAVPAGHIGGLVATHGPIAVDDVLGDLVLSVTQVNGAVCVGRSVMQDELLVTLVLLEQLLEDLVLLPHLQTGRLVLCEACAHRKLRLWEIRGGLVLVCQLLRPFFSLGAIKKRPSLSAGTKRHKGRTPLYHPASGSTPP